MYIDKMIKKEVLILIVSILVVLALITSVSFSYFLAVDNGEDNVINIGDLKITFCEDESCKKDYANFGQVIGTKKVNGESVINNIYPYPNETDALKETPYIFNIKNTGSLDILLTIKLNEDEDYIPSSNYSNYESITKLYSENIKVGISDCSNSIDRDNVLINSYSSLIDNTILNNDTLSVNEDKTYCLWTWLDENTPNSVQNTYFVANLDFKAEYKPR